MNRLASYTIGTLLLAGQVGSGAQQTTSLQLPPNVERTFSSPEAYVTDADQVAYMMGGLQIRSLYKELVETGKMTPTAFHDAVLKAGSMPIEMLRALLTAQPLTRDYRAQWKYYGAVTAANSSPRE